MRRETFTHVSEGLSGQPLQAYPAIRCHETSRQHERRGLPSAVDTFRSVLLGDVAFTSLATERVTLAGMVSYWCCDSAYLSSVGLVDRFDLVHCRCSSSPRLSLDMHA